jgi:hypothetical protein
MRVLVGAARCIAMSMAMALFASGPAWAQILKLNAYPPPKDGLILFEMLRPVESPDLFHSWRANLGYQYGGLESKLASQPERRDLNSETAGLNFRVGAQSFGSIDLTLSDQTLNLRAFGLSTSADLNEVGIRASGGTMLLPFLAVGGSLARSKLDGTYRFGPMPVDQASGAIMSTSAFAALLYPVDDWKLSLTGAYTYDARTESLGTHRHAHVRRLASHRRAARRRDEPGVVSCHRSKNLPRRPPGRGLAAAIGRPDLQIDGSDEYESDRQHVSDERRLRLRERFGRPQLQILIPRPRRANARWEGDPPGVQGSEEPRKRQGKRFRARPKASR